MDLVSVTISPLPSKNSHAAAPRRLFSFLSVAWGFVSDVDIESERCVFYVKAQVIWLVLFFEKVSMLLNSLKF